MPVRRGRCFSRIRSHRRKLTFMEMMSRHRAGAKKSSIDLRNNLRMLFSGAVRLAANHVLRSKWNEKVPALKVSQEWSTAPPSAWFICPDFSSPSGGVRKLYRSVDILTAAGCSAAIVHKRPGFRCTWFDNRTRVVPSNEVSVSRKDVIVVPEVYG